MCIGIPKFLFSYSKPKTLVTILQFSCPVLCIEYKAGGKLYIDFMGSKLELDGTLQSVEVFVATLGCNQLTYVETI